MRVNSVQYVFAVCRVVMYIEVSCRPIDRAFAADDDSVKKGSGAARNALEDNGGIAPAGGLVGAAKVAFQTQQPTIYSR